MQISGIPYSPGSYSYWTIIYGTLTVTLIFFSCIYVYYEKRHKLHLPKVLRYFLSSSFNLPSFSMVRLHASPLIHSEYENILFERDCTDENPENTISNEMTLLVFKQSGTKNQYTTSDGDT